MFGPFGFPAEDLLAEAPPDYEWERLLLTIKLGVAAGFFLVIFPMFFASPVFEGEAVEKEEKEGIKTTKTITVAPSKKKRSKTSKNQTTEAPKESSTADAKEPVAYEVDPKATLYGVAGFMVSFVYILLMHSPDNYYASNGVFQAPLLTPDECKYMLDMADRVADRNYESAKAVSAMYSLTGEEVNTTTSAFLEDPYGWNKMRHSVYQTTDLNLVTDPFTNEDRDYISEKLHTRLSPLLQRIYGIPPSSVRCNDVSVHYFEKEEC